MKELSMAIGLLLTFSVGALAQATSRYAIPETGRKANFYENRAMEFLKGERFAEAVLYSAIALNSDPKREQVRGAHKGITEGFQKAFESIESAITSAKLQAEKFDSEDPDPVMNARFAKLDHYRMAKMIMDELQKVPPELLKSQGRKTEDVSFTYKDYSSEVTDATKAYNDGKPIAADLKYKMAEKVFADKSIKSSRKAAQLYRGISLYVPDYKDASAKYEQARELGTTNVAIATFLDLHDKNKYGNIGAPASERIISTMINGVQYRREFFRIITNEKFNRILADQRINVEQFTSEGSSIAIKGVQALVTGQISRVDNVVNRDEPATYEREKEITIRTEKYVDSDGKTKERNITEKVKGTYVSYSKRTVVTLKASITIVDSQNHEILSTQTFETNGTETVSWARFSGDGRVLTSHEKGWIKDEPGDAPIQGPLSAAINDFVNQAVQMIDVFAKSAGD
jgi:hypothetical protein